MDHIDSKTCASREVVRNISRLVRKGQLSRSILLEFYKIRELVWQNASFKGLDLDGKTLKSLHSILQLGVYFKIGNKVAVFRRPVTEKDNTEKITSSFSILKSWSPTSFDDEDLAVALAKKVYLRAGPSLQWQARGTALTDIFETKNRFAPHYLFLLFEIRLDDEKRLSTKGHLDERKRTEPFAGWFDIQSYDMHNIQAQFFDQDLSEHLTIEFNGAIDRLLLTSLKRNDTEPLEDTTRGLARYYPANHLVEDTPKCDFTVGGVEFDENMAALLRVIEQIKKTSGNGTKEVTLQDVIKFEPNFHGLGINGPAFLAWIKKLYDRAFN